MCMRMQDNFPGCRVLSYWVMSNHFHILLEVPPMPVGGADAEYRWSSYGQAAGELWSMRDLRVRV